jgi:long-chain acyl-CoA synthetase
LEQKTQPVRFGTYARRNPKALAVVDPSGIPWSRGQIADAANGLSRALREEGLVAGDVLAIIAPNCAEYLVTYLAATQIGLYLVPVNWHLASPEIQFILENCRASAIVVHERFRSVMSTVLPRMAVPPRIRISFGSIPEFGSLQDFVREMPTAALEHPVQGRVLAYTSATTGKPKGVSLPLAGAERTLDLSIEMRVAVGTQPEEHVHLYVSMLYHGAPLDGAAMGLHMGHVIVLTDHVTPEAVLQLIEKYRVTIAYVVPAMFVRLLALPTEVRGRYCTSSLRRVVHTGATCPAEVKRKMIAWWGPIFWEAYGAAEGAGTLVGSVEWLKYPGTVGRPMPGTQLKIVGDDGEELPQGSVGTIYMTRYSGDRFEYLGDPEKTRACHRGEFFTVGDIGYLNEAGFLFLCDRKIDMINLSGMKVYSAEIESVLILHPHVDDCAVFGIPNELTGESIVALIQSSVGAPAPRELTLAVRRFLGEHIAPVKLPRYMEVVRSLSRDDTGKLQKRRLRESYLSRVERSSAAVSTSE